MAQKEIYLSQLGRDFVHKPAVATGAGDIPMTLALISGIGSLADASVGVLSESVTNATINVSRESVIQLKEPHMAALHLVHFSAC